MNTRTLTSKSLAAGTAVRSRTDILAALLAGLLGLALLWGAGFAAPTALHNAAHDGRHAFAFPCH